MNPIDFRTDPSRYRHWRLAVEGAVATLTLDVDPAGGLFPGTELKLNSYDLGVDIELADAVQRLRFEHPEVRAVVIRSGKDNVFCAGANIGALAKATHGHKVNFCKFTNETRLAIEDASENSGQRYLAAVSGTAAGGGYELAAACDWITLIDDRRSAVALPETPLLAVLPAPAGSPASPTSARCAATAPTCSAPPKKACAASAPSIGGWSTRSRRPRPGTNGSPSVPRRWLGRRIGRGCTGHRAAAAGAGDRRRRDCLSASARRARPGQTAR